MKAVKDMSDAEVLALAGGMGPAIIGKELYERAERIRKVNPGGILGPAIVGDTNAPATSAPATETDPRFAALSKLAAKKLADEIAALDPVADKALLMALYQHEEARESRNEGAGRKTVYAALAEKGVGGEGTE